jgi:hypothetical protein
MKIYRHGEIGLVKISKLPKGLELAKTNILATGSHSNSHTFDKGRLYLKNVNDYVFGYFVAKDTKLFHPEHSPKGCKVKDGIYELRKQQEFTPQGLVPVQD